MKTKITKVNEIASTKFLSFYEVEYKNKLGQDKKWNVTSRLDIDRYKNRINTHNDGSDAVLIIAYHTQKNKLVLVKQYRIPINEYIYEIPAGLMEQGEDIADCTKRELMEETGLQLLEIKKVYKNIYISPGMSDECTDIVVCTCTGEPTTKYLEDDEEIEVCMFSKEDIDSLELNMDLKTLFGIEFFINNF